MEKVDVDIVTNGDVTPLTLPEPEVLVSMQGVTEEVAADSVRVELVPEDQVEARLVHQVLHAIGIPWSFSCSMTSRVFCFFLSGIPVLATSIDP